MINITKLKRAYKKFAKKYTPFISFMTGLTLLIVGLINHYLGFHNMDLAQDLEEVQYISELILLQNNVTDYDVKFIENTFSDKHIDLDTAYSIGAKNIIISPILLIFGSYFLFVGIMIYEYKIGNFKRF